MIQGNSCIIAEIPLNCVFFGTPCIFITYITYIFLVKAPGDLEPRPADLSVNEEAEVEVKHYLFGGGGSSL